MSLIKTLIRSLVRTFYEANMGFFLVVLYLAFGVMRSNEHIAIATSIASSLHLTLLTLLLWSIYYLKSYGFIFKILNKKSFLFLRHLAIQPKVKQFSRLFIINLLIGFPAWAYAGFISIFNFKYGTILNFSLMIGLLAVINAAITLRIITLLKQPIKEAYSGLLNKYVSKHFSITYPLWYIRHVFSHEPLLLFLSKAGSLMLLIGSYYLFETDVYDWRLLAVGVLFSFMLNSMLIYNYDEFNRTNYWVANLPLKHSKIISSSFITTTILFIPEIIFILFRHSKIISFSEGLGLLTFSLSMAYFLKSSMLLKPIRKENYGKRIFYLMIIMIFLIMYSIPLILLNLALIGSGIFIMSHYYKLIIIKD